MVEVCVKETFSKKVMTFYFLLYVNFWGTCTQHAGLLHKYTYVMVVCCIHPLTSTLGISPNVIPPQFPHPLLSLP